MHNLLSSFMLYYSVNGVCVVVFLPPEFFTDQRVISMFGISVSWGKAQCSHFQFMARYPMMHHSQAWVKRCPA